MGAGGRTREGKARQGERGGEGGNKNGLARREWM